MLGCVVGRSAVASFDTPAPGEPAIAPHPQLTFRADGGESRHGSVPDLLDAIRLLLLKHGPLERRETARVTRLPLYGKLASDPGRFLAPALARQSRRAREGGRRGREGQ